MRYSVLLWAISLIVFGGWWSGPAWALTLEVDLRPEAVLASDHLWLSDVAAISYPDPSWESELQRLDLGYVPAPGEVRIIRPQEIFDRVVARRVPGLDYIYFSGADSCEVTTASQLLPWSEMSALITQELYQMFPFADRIEILPLGSPTGIILPPGSSVDLFVPHENKPWGRATAQFTVRSSGGERQENVTVSMKVFRDVVRAQDTLRPGDVIGEDQLQVGQEELTVSNERSFTVPDDVIGFEARRAMRPGDVITPDKIQKETLIQRGDLVTMVVRSGLITVTATGLARGSGSLGEVIVVENPETRDRIYAEVIGERVVEVIVQ